MSIERRVPEASAADPVTAADVRVADEQARREFAERGAELLERLRHL